MASHYDRLHYRHGAGLRRQRPLLGRLLRPCVSHHRRLGLEGFCCLCSLGDSRLGWEAHQEILETSELQEGSGLMGI